MALESSAAAATATAGAGSGSDGEADATRFYSRRRSRSPSPIPSRSRSRSKTPPPSIAPGAAPLSSTPTSAGADVAAASDADAGAGGRAPSPRRGDGKGPPSDHVDSDADADAGTGRRVPSPRRRGERSPSFHSGSDADAGRVPSPRRNRERTPRLHSDSDSDNSVATANFTATTSEDDGGGAGAASPSPRPRPSSPIKVSSIKPIRTRPMDVPFRDAAASSDLRTKRRHRPIERRTPEYQKRPSRVWSPEDELTILNALIEYRAKEGRLPGSSQDTGKLHLQIYGRLTANASTTQLSDKVRRLKHKYKLQVKRAKNGRVPDLPTEHDRSVYELSKKVWRLKSLEGRSLVHEEGCREQ